MGGTPSTAVQDAKHNGRSDQECIDLVLPLFYTKQPITSAELDAAVVVWRMIMNNTSAHFKQLKKNGGPSFEFNTCMELFYHTFYTRMFDVHPIAKSLFHRSINKQGTFFVRFISMALSQLNDEEKWEKSFKNLTDIHNKMGVKSIEYGVAGEVLFHSIQVCVGACYTETVHNGWVKIYSKMLSSIIPVAVKFELDCKHMADEAATKRFKDKSKNSVMMSSSGAVDPSSIFSQHHTSMSGNIENPSPNQPLFTPTTSGVGVSHMQQGKVGVDTGDGAKRAEEERAATPVDMEDASVVPTSESRQELPSAEATRSSADALKANSAAAAQAVQLMSTERR